MTIYLNVLPSSVPATCLPHAELKATQVLSVVPCSLYVMKNKKQEIILVITDFLQKLSLNISTEPLLLVCTALSWIVTVPAAQYFRRCSGSLLIFRETPRFPFLLFMGISQSAAEKQGSKCFTCCWMSPAPSSYLKV